MQRKEQRKYRCNSMLYSEGCILGVGALEAVKYYSDIDIAPESCDFCNLLQHLCNVGARPAPSLYTVQQHAVPDRACRGILGICAKLIYGPGLQCVQSSYPVAYEGNYLQMGILAYNIYITNPNPNLPPTLCSSINELDFLLNIGIYPIISIAYLSLTPLGEDPFNYKVLLSRLVNASQ